MMKDKLVHIFIAIGLLLISVCNVASEVQYPSVERSGANTPSYFLRLYSAGRTQTAGSEAKPEVSRYEEIYRTLPAIMQHYNYVKGEKAKLQSDTDTLVRLFQQSKNKGQQDLAAMRSSEGDMKENTLSSEELQNIIGKERNTLRHTEQGETHEIGSSTGNSIQEKRQEGGGMWKRQEGGGAWKRQEGGGAWKRQEGGGGWKRQEGGGGWKRQEGGGAWKRQEGGGGWKRQEGGGEWKRQEGGGAWKRQEGGGEWKRQEGGGGWKRQEGGGEWKRQEGGGAWKRQEGGGGWKRQEGGGAWKRQEGGGAWKRQEGGGEWKRHDGETDLNKRQEGGGEWKKRDI